MWEYRVVPYFAGLVGTAKPDQRMTIAAQQFADVIRSNAIQGWEFYRTDPITYFENPGCVAGLLGARPVQVVYQCAVFRRALSR